MKTTIGVNQNSATIHSTAREHQSTPKGSASDGEGKLSRGIAVVVRASTRSVVLTTRPIATDRAQKTQRLNRELELGYRIPVQTTDSK